MSYELAKELKDAGFPQTNGDHYVGKEVWDETMQSDYETRNTPLRSTWIKCQTLSELIEACGVGFKELELIGLGKDGWGHLGKIVEMWEARSSIRGVLIEVASTPEEAVARLWLALNKI